MEILQHPPIQSSLQDVETVLGDYVMDIHISFGDGKYVYMPIYYLAN